MESSVKATAIRFPRALYVCDFPPANRGGGDTLMYRLLNQCSPEELCLIFSSRGRNAFAATTLGGHPHSWFPELAGGKRHGFRRVFVLLDRLLLPFLTIWIMWRAWHWRPDVLISVAHGYM